MSWSPQEDAVLIYYASRDVPISIVADMIGLRCHTRRTSGDITNRVASIRNCESLAYGYDLYPNMRWNSDRVDDWLARAARAMRGGVDALVALLRYDGAAKRAVQRACCPC